MPSTSPTARSRRTSVRTPPRRISPHSAVRHIQTGHFHEGPGYSVWRPDGTGDWLITLTLGGQGRFGHHAGDFLAKPGDLVMLRPGTLADYGVEPQLKAWEVLWAHFQPRPHWHPLLRWPEAAPAHAGEPGSPGLMTLRADEPRVAREIAEAFDQVHRQAMSTLSSRHLFALNALERVLLWCELANPLRGGSGLDDRVQLAMDYLSQHMTRKVALADVAAAAHLSVSRLCELFKLQTGLSPHQFLEKQRLDRARQLLETTSHSIQSIAAQVGYAHPFHFTQRFTRYAGINPRAYRRSKDHR